MQYMPPIADDASAGASADVTLTAVGSSPVALLSGPSGDVPDSQPLTLDASASSDPDAPAAAQRLSYSWECRREDHPAPCFSSAAQGDRDTTPSVWVLPAGALASGVWHTFTVTVSKEVAAGATPLQAAASVTVRPRSSNVAFPRGALSRQCSAAGCAAPHAADQPLTLRLQLEPGFE